MVFLIVCVLIYKDLKETFKIQSIYKLGIG